PPRGSPRDDEEKTMTTTITATEVNVYQRGTPGGRVHYQYDYKVTMPDVTSYRERLKARGATSETAARQIGLRRLHDVLRRGPNPRKANERPPTVEEFAPLWLAKRSGHDQGGLTRQVGCVCQEPGRTLLLPANSRRSLGRGTWHN